MTLDHTSSDVHVDQERLVDLVLGDPPADEEQAHLDACSLCRSSMDDLTRTLTVTRETSGTSLITPPASVWEAIDAEVSGTGAAGRAEEAGPQATVRPLRQRRRPPATWLAAACAAGLLLGIGGTVLADRVLPSETVDTRTVASTQLQTLDTGERLGSAAVRQRDGQLVLEVVSPEVDPGPGYKEVWLINEDGERMVSVGVLDASSSEQSFGISRELLDKGYVVVDISREKFDDQPEHSGDSIVRGQLVQQS